MFRSGNSPIGGVAEVGIENKKILQLAHNVHERPYSHSFLVA